MFYSDSPLIDSIPYSMRPSKEGYIGNAIIFLNTKLSGTVHDENNLVETAKMLGFQHHVFRDLSMRQYHDALYFISNPPLEKTPSIPEDVWHARILPEHEAILVVVVSHGNKDCFLTADGRLFPDKHIDLYLNENKCTLMRGKPKIIFFNKCRTEGGGEGVPTVPQHTDRILSLNGSMEYDTYFGSDSSTYSNFLHIYSSSKGTISLRHIDTGSFVISRLPDEYKKYGTSKEFRKFIQIFRARMISEINMKVKSSPGYLEVTQCVTTECDTLLRDIYFPHVSGSESLEEMEVEQMDACGKNVWDEPSACLNTAECRKKNGWLNSRFLRRMKKSKKGRQALTQGAKSPIRRFFSLNCLKS